MMKYRGGAFGIGLSFLAVGRYALLRGRIKWDQDRYIEGSRARMIGLGAAVVGIVCVAFGMFVPEPIWESF